MVVRAIKLRSEDMRKAKSKRNKEIARDKSKASAIRTSIKVKKLGGIFVSDKNNNREFVSGESKTILNPRTGLFESVFVRDPELFTLEGKKAKDDPTGIIKGFSRADLVKIKAQDRTLANEKKQFRTDLLRGAIPTARENVLRELERKDKKREDIKRLFNLQIPTARKQVEKKANTLNFRINEGIRKGIFSREDVNPIIKAVNSKATIRPDDNRIIELIKNKAKSREELRKKRDIAISDVLRLSKKIETANKNYNDFVEISLRSLRKPVLKGNTTKNSRLGLGEKIFKSETSTQRISENVLKTLAKFNPAIITANVVGGLQAYRILREGGVINPKELVSKGIRGTIPIAKKTINKIKNIKPEDLKKAYEKANKEAIKLAIKSAKNLDPRTEKGLTNIIVLSALLRVDKLILKGAKKGISKSIASSKELQNSLKKQGIEFAKPEAKEILSALTPTKLLKSKAARTKGVKGKISKAELRKRASGQITRQIQKESKKKAKKAEKLQVFVAKGEKPKPKINFIKIKPKKELELVDITKQLSESVKVKKREEVILDKFKNFRKGKKTTTKEQRRLAKKIAEGEIPLRDVPKYLKVRTTKTGKTKISFVKKPVVKKVITKKEQPIKVEKPQITVFKKNTQKKKEKPVKTRKLTKTETRKKQRQLEKPKQLGLNKENQKYATADFVKKDLRPETVYKDLIIPEEVQIKGFRKGQASKLFNKLQKKKEELIRNRKEEAFKLNKKIKSKSFLEKEIDVKNLNKVKNILNDIIKGGELNKLKINILDKFSNSDKIGFATSVAIKKLLAIDENIKIAPKISNKIKSITKIKYKSKSITKIKYKSKFSQQKQIKKIPEKIIKPKQTPKPKKIKILQPQKKIIKPKIKIIKPLKSKPTRKPIEQRQPKPPEQPKTPKFILFPSEKLNKFKKIKSQTKGIKYTFTPTLLSPKKKNKDEEKINYTFTGLELRGL